MNTPLQTIVKLALATSTGKDLSLDNQPVMAYAFDYARCSYSGLPRTKAFRYIESFFGRLGNYTFRCRNAILYVLSAGARSTMR